MQNQPCRREDCMHFYQSVAGNLCLSGRKAEIIPEDDSCAGVFTQELFQTSSSVHEKAEDLAGSYVPRAA